MFIGTVFPPFLYLKPMSGPCVPKRIPDLLWLELLLNDILELVLFPGTRWTGKLPVSDSCEVPRNSPYICSRSCSKLHYRLKKYSTSIHQQLTCNRFPFRVDPAGEINFFKEICRGNEALYPAHCCRPIFVNRGRSRHCGKSFSQFSRFT